jgi:arylsulfatase A-like enzyme
LAPFALGVLVLTVSTCQSDRHVAPVPPGVGHLAAAAAQAPVELLQDPDFEGGAAAWLNHDGAGRGLDTAVFHGGARAQQIQGSSAGDLVVYQDVPVEAGDSLDASGWVSTNGLDGIGATAAILWLDAAGLSDTVPPPNLLGADTLGTVAGTTGWAHVSRSTVVPAGATVARFVVQVALEADSTGAAWFDDLSLLLIPPPVDTTPPSVSVTAPAAGSFVSGPVDLTADATDDDSVVAVQFFVDGIAVAADSAPPYQVAYAPDTLGDGAHVVTAEARDVAGHVTLSAAVDVTVDDTAPDVVITAPVDGATIAGVTTLAATATDSVGVAGVQFYVDSVAVGAEVTTAPYAISYNADTLANGTIQISAVARDSAGHTTASAPVTVTVNNPPPRDVVVVITDDQRHDQMQYMPLTTAALNGQTVRFKKAFVTTSLCCPSRATILTGKYAHNHGVLTNAAPTGGATVFDPTTTLATALMAKGYRTGLIGKYMNQYERLAPAVPPGWTDFEAMLFKATLPDAGYLNYELNVNGLVSAYGPGAADYSTDVLTNRAVQFIQSTHPRKSMFLFFTPFAPHIPATPHPQDAGLFASQPNWRPKSWNEADVSDKPTWIKALKKFTAAQIAQADSMHRRQLESLQAVDRSVNTLIATLKAKGRWKNTLFIYLSDNGYAWGEHRLLDRKMCPYEECVRVPMWVRAPGLAFRQDTQLVANVDLTPTIATWTGVTLPGMNGMDLWPLLKNKAAPWRTDLLLEHLGQAGTNLNSRSVRDTRYVYTEYENGEREFYDLKVDPLQLTNAVNQPAHAARVAAMQARLAVLRGQ